jgi:RNA polymerase sigma-70 factor (ECF subfamily)
MEADERATAEDVRWGGWMAAAQRGDAVAYRKLLEELLPVVRRWVRARLFDAVLAEDVVQNALLNLHRARRSYRPERRFKPWLRAIVRNAVTDALRETGRRREREGLVDSFDALPHARVEPDAAGAGNGPLSPALRSALEELPASQRQAVELIHVEGLSVSAAAARAGVSVGALKVRAHRGYQALRQALDGREDELR